MLAALSVLLVPHDAYAWGLATHIELARNLLDGYRDLLASNAPSILEHSRMFLYGVLSPDHFLAKNLQEYPKHSHNWDRAFQMLEEAPDDEYRAFSWGYLCHLAADVVAHNSFVPAKILQRPGFNGRQHAYWEYRFEHFQPEEAWKMVQETYELKDQDRFDRFLKQFVLTSVLGFDANLRITRKVFDVLRSNPSRRLMDRMDRRSNHNMERLEVEAFMNAALHCMVDVVQKGRDSRVTRMDPRGGAPISYARSISKTVSTLRGSARSVDGTKSSPSSQRPLLSPMLRDERGRTHGTFVSGLPRSFAGQVKKDIHATRKTRRKPKPKS